MNYGACGYIGCFACSQALTKDKAIFFTSTCATVLQDPEMLKGLEKLLDLEIDASELDKKAFLNLTFPVAHYVENALKSARTTVWSSFQI